MKKLGSPVIATILMVAITVVLAGVLYVWASSAEGNTDGDLSLYAFSAVDSNGAPPPNTDDNLIRVTMDQGSDLNWASVSVSIKLTAQTSNHLLKPRFDGADCSAEFGDTSTTYGPSVTVSQLQSLAKTYVPKEYAKSKLESSTQEKVQPSTLLQLSLNEVR